MWYTIGMSIPLTYQNITSQYEYLIAVSKNLNKVIMDVRQLINIEDGRPDYQSQINKLGIALSDLQKKIDSAIEELQEQRALINNLQDEIVQVNADAQKGIVSVRNEIIVVRDTAQKNLINAITNLQNEIDNNASYVDALGKTIYEELITYINSLYLSDNLYYVMNPITGQFDEINKTLQMMWDFTNHMLSIKEFETLGMTIDEFNSLGLTIEQYMHGFWRIADDIKLQKAFLMFNPLSGKQENVKNIVYDILTSQTILPYAITIREFDSLNLIVDEFDTKNITCENFYINARNLL